MKLVVAYVDPDHYEGIREALAGLGFPSLSVLTASGSVPEVTLDATYRGTAMEGHSRPKARLECVVGADHAQTIIDTVIEEAGDRTFVYVVPVEQAFPIGTVKTDEATIAG